ncbi:transposase [Kocuria sp. ZOR0020]|uniref:transposase n=1 Tax=Kocuria sp. ZOR0020 TaxID=1339234 RepID=UPI00064576B8|nr:transposase [Kocuria sp. ZOR0020]
MPKKFSPELRERAVRMVLERQAAVGGPRSHSIRVIGPQVGVGEETLRMWCNRHGHEIAPAAAGETPEQEIRRLRRELAEARRANEILKAASAFFAAELDRPTTR